ncbi:hypothetical protein [Paenibacillus sp. MMS20-IR301]|uniref:hypothetical protein n=1 Tax=Paenibacillus sp. MMS20-IR301 TaxID=2895946 RepID=UPI0028EB636B|nr:hypothetical protein [Paenibacillus sp. MMS20-IR301]WNS42656.1 hypothetical protein LOS79_27310 [Paenibacillus sp. MMS20-IR301]
MITQLIWIMSIYATAAALVQLLHHRGKTREHVRPGKRLQYILITRNHEAVVEWYIRILAFHASWAGSPLQVTVADDSSADGTLNIASRLDVCSSPVLSLYSGGNGNEPPERMVVDLRMQEPRLPLRMMRLPGSGGYGSKHGGA